MPSSAPTFTVHRSKPRASLSQLPQRDGAGAGPTLPGDGVKAHQVGALELAQPYRGQHPGGQGQGRSGGSSAAFPPGPSLGCFQSHVLGCPSPDGSAASETPALSAHMLLCTQHGGQGLPSTQRTRDHLLPTVSSTTPHQARPTTIKEGEAWRRMWQLQDSSDPQTALTAGTRRALPIGAGTQVHVYHLLAGRPGTNNSTSVPHLPPLGNDVITATQHGLREKRSSACDVHRTEPHPTPEGLRVH